MACRFVCMWMQPQLAAGGRFPSPPPCWVELSLEEGVGGGICWDSSCATWLTQKCYWVCQKLLTVVSLMGSWQTRQFISGAGLHTEPLSEVCAFVKMTGQDSSRLTWRCVTVTGIGRGWDINVALLLIRLLKWTSFQICLNSNDAQVDYKPSISYNFITWRSTCHPDQKLSISSII